MSDRVRIERVTSHPIAVVRRRVAARDLSRVVPEACGFVWEVVKSAQPQDPGRHVAVYRDAGDGLLDVEVGVEVGTPIAGYAEVAGSITPAGNVATMTHFGPYPELGEAHHAILQWCAGQGHIVTATRWEIYGHWQAEWNNDPSKIRTDIFYLLAS